MRLNGVITVATESLDVDEGTSIDDLQRFALRMRGFDAGGVVFTTVPIADVNGVRLFHTEQGDGEPLLCVMGLASDSQGWGLQMEALSDAFRVIVFDNRDVGRSTQCDTDYDIADLADDAIALADHLGELRAGVDRVDVPEYAVVAEAPGQTIEESPGERLAILAAVADEDSPFG